jgi:YidC/Oxa1 family membrane protein insertase
VAEPERTIAIETSQWVAVFSNRGAAPTSWKLVKGPDGRPIHASDGSDLEMIPAVALQPLGPPLRLAIPGDDAATARLAQATYAASVRSGDGVAQPAGERLTIADGETVELAFQTPDAGTNQIVTKRFIFTGGQYDFRVAVDSSAGSRPFALVVGPRVGDQSVRTEGTYTHTPPYAVVTTAAGTATYVHGTDVADGQQKPIEGFARWAGVTDNYFGMAVATPSEGAQAVVTNTKLKFVESEETPHDFLSIIVPVESGKAAHVFVGPKDLDLLPVVSKHAAETVGSAVDYSDLINYGFFKWLVKPIIPVIDGALEITNRITGNYGWSIIIVTMLFNLLFFPLRYKSSVAMKRAAKLQPRMKELQEKLKKYKPTDPQFKEVQAEQMALMKEGNPLGGCLPMLVQFPFFWAFFVYFTTTFDVRQQPWIGWVQDLTAPDAYYILPVVMCAAQIGATQLMPMPQSDDPAMKMQRTLMTWVMPVFITYFFLVAAPSGLVLYWLTLNLMGIVMQYAINRMLPADVQQVPPPGGKGSKKNKEPKKPSPTELVGSEK